VADFTTLPMQVGGSDDGNSLSTRLASHLLMLSISTLCRKLIFFLLSDQPLAQVEMQRRQLVITQKPERLAWLPSSEDHSSKASGIALVIRFQTGSGVIFLRAKGSGL